MTHAEVAVSVALALLAGATSGLTWVETSCDGFRDGAFSYNLYASHRDSGGGELGA